MGETQNTGRHFVRETHITVTPDHKIVGSGLHCACPNGRMTNNELFKSVPVYGLKGIRKKAFRLKGKQHETLQRIVIREKTRCDASRGGVHESA